MTRLLIAGGELVDGTGSPPRRADVAIEGGRVAEIGTGLAPGSRTIDGGGMLVAPGFVDIHTHDDFTLPLRPQAEARVRQGITTTVTGNCGFSPFPLDDSPQARRHGAFFEPGLSERWRDLEGFGDSLRQAGLAVNVAPLVGLGAVRLAVVGEDAERASPAQITEMQTLVRGAMRQGAYGASSGLVYAPGCYAEPDEIAGLLPVVGESGGFYATHMRDEAGGVEESVAESIATGRRAACPVQISHHKAIGRSNWGKVERTLKLIDSANRDGGDITLDAYPYVAGSSTLLSLVPAEHQAGGVDALRRRLADPAARKGIVAAVREERVFGLSDVVLALVPSRPDLEGKRLTEVSPAAAAELVVDLIAADGAEVVMVAFGMSPADVATVLSHPRTMVGSDGWVLSTDASPCPHPRNFSTTARFLTAFVRDNPLIELPAAIRKLSALPAARLGLRERGTLVPGAVADVTVLDYERLRDRASFDRPCAYPEGIEHVLVAGVPVLESSEPTAERPGRVLDRTAER